MARKSFAQAQEDNKNNNRDYTPSFYLNKEKDSTFIRFLFNNLDDVSIHSIHSVAMPGKSGKTYFAQVDCVGDGCPFCKHATKDTPFSRARDMGYMPVLQIYNENGEYEPTFKVFNRSVVWMSDVLVGFEARYGLDNIVEIERVGSGNKTTYMLYPAMKGYKGQELPELPPLEKLLDDFEVTQEAIEDGIRTWTVEDMERYIATGSPYENNNDNEEEDKPVVVTRRRGF